MDLFSNSSKSMSLMAITNNITKPQDKFFFRPMIGVDKDGETVRVLDMETEFEEKFFVLFFFPMDFKVVSSEVLSFKEHLDEFAKYSCEIVGVTSEDPWTVKRWISRDISGGWFGGPVGFPILTDKDLSVYMSTGVARDVKEFVRLMRIFRHPDLTGEALTSGWTPGVIL